METRQGAQQVLLRFLCPHLVPPETDGISQLLWRVMQTEKIKHAGTSRCHAPQVRSGFTHAKQRRVPPPHPTPPPPQKSECAEPNLVTSAEGLSDINVLCSSVIPSAAHTKRTCKCTVVFIFTIKLCIHLPNTLNISPWYLPLCIFIFCFSLLLLFYITTYL